MQALEISLNGKRVCVAGTAPNKTLATVVSWTHREPGTWRFNIGGIVGGDSNEHFDWNVPALSVGDQVSIRVVETDAGDHPDEMYDPKIRHQN